MLSRRVIAYYGLIRDSESLPATYEFAAGSAAPKEIGLRWESRGSPIYSAGLCSRADSHTPVAPKSANDCCFLFGFSLHLPVKGSAITLVVSRLQSSLRAYFALMLRPASWLALLSRTFTFELALAGSPRTNVEYDYVDKQSIPTAGLSPASPTALWAAGRVGKGRPAGSIELRVSPSPSKIPYGGFSPVRLQMDRQWRPSTTSRGLSAVHIRPMIPSYTPPQLQLPGIRDPRRDYPFENLSVQCGTTPSNRQHVHPEALGSPSGYVVPAGHSLLRPHPPL
jgi:hypothetical protein